jgi:hypothetical protein
MIHALKNPPNNTHDVIKGVIIFATEAAAEHVAYTLNRNDEDPDPHIGMGLWQTFQATFPNDGSLS